MEKRRSFFRKRRSFFRKRGRFSEECRSFSECYRKAFGRCGAQLLECCGEDRVSFSRARITAILYFLLSQPSQNYL